MPEPPLKVFESEAISVKDEADVGVGSPDSPVRGFVAVLDALGAKNFSKREAEEFLKARDEFLPLIHEMAEKDVKINPKHLKRFIFNDTVILAYVRDVSWHDAWVFGHVLRAFQTHFLGRQIFFRGAFSIGEFYRVDEANNTLMGPAVTDAASWYERADWIGVNATPFASLFLDGVLHREYDKLDYVLVDYEVPLKDKGRRRLKVVNWPKGIFLKNGKHADKSKAAILKLLAKQPFPVGAESKYFHAMEFYDRVATEQFLTPSTSTSGIGTFDIETSGAPSGGK